MTRRVLILLLAAVLLGAACSSENAAPSSSSTIAPSIPAPPPTPVVRTHPRGTRTNIAAVDAILEAVEGNDLARLAAIVEFRMIACRTVIRDAGDLPACPEGVPDGSRVDVFPEGYCEGSYIYRGSVPEAFGNLATAQVFGVYRGSPLGSPVDYAIVLWPGGLWHIRGGRVVAIDHGCGATPEGLVSGWQLTETLLAPP